MSFNKVLIMGNLGKDPEVKFLQSGTAAVTLSVATNKRWKDKEGNKQERTDWHRVVAFGKTAELIGEHLKKGSQALFEGELQTRKWKDKEGKDQYTVEVLVNQLTFVGRGGGGGGGREEPPLEEPAGSAAGGGGKEPSFTEEDIPF